MTALEECDLLIVGAGPAGSAAAIAALRARPGARVVVLDRFPLGRDKVCGDGIAPHAVRELESLGVDAVRPEEIVPSVRLSAHEGPTSAAVTASPGYVVPRREFDERLARAAIDAGADVRQEKAVSLVQDDDGVTLNGRLRAPVLIGADGSNSVVRRLVGQPANSGAALAVAVRGYAPTPVGLPHELQIRWDSRRSGGLCYAWAFPVADGTTNVGYGMSSAAPGVSRRLLVERLRALLPEFDLDGVELVGHTLPLSTSRPSPEVGRVLLVGDAASLINPFTGEGIYSAIASGAMAGRAAVTDPETAGAIYSRELAARFSRQHRQMKQLYRFIDSRALLETVIRACRHDTRMFDLLLDVGLGDRSFRPADLVRFGRHARPALRLRGRRR
jgi:geranylgeranyl reductase family protein